MHRFLLLAILSLAALTAAAVAAPRRVELAPPGSAVGFRAYGLGLLPLDGQFARFRGWLTYDPEQPAVCQVNLAVEVASLAMSDAGTRDLVVGPDFMDASNHPLMVYAGTCQPSGLGGTLDLRGVNRPFGLSLTWRADRVVAVGQLHRADWGMTAMPILAGPIIRIEVTVPLSNPAHASREQ
jgi:polyisoprenoid-binding protein YceI